MKINKIITACNENRIYSDFIEINAKSWKKLYDITIDIAIIAKDPDNSSLVDHAKKYCNVHVFKEQEGILSSVQAKVSRLLLASKEIFKEDICALSDIDMIPLQPVLFSPFENVPENHLVMWGYDHPAYVGIDRGKWPMDRTIAKGSTFKEIVNPANLNDFDLLEYWKNYKLIDGRESISLPFSVFSDESLLRALHSQWNEKDLRTTKISRLALEKSMLGGRMNPPNELNLEKLKNGTYFEAHGFRPIQKYPIHFQEIKKIVDQ